MQGIKKSYPSVIALRGVDFELRRGEVHCLVGENGAGKSTLMRVLAGAEQPDEGTVTIDGVAHTALDPHSGHELGISAIYQETDLVPHLTVAENMFLGHEPRNAVRGFARRTMRNRAQAVLDELGIAASPNARVSELSAATAQLVQIGKALTRDSRVLIMDEPGAVLSDHELERLFSLIARLRDRGIGIIYISHRLEEILHIGDRVTVMRDGERVETTSIEGVTLESLIRAMVGRPLERRFPKRSAVADEVMLSVRGLSLKGRLHDISFDVRKGEILGVAGLVGAGRSAMLGCLFGALRPTSGDVLLNGQPIKVRNPRASIRQGFGLVPEDRRGQGLLIDRSVEDNIVLPVIDKLFPRGRVVRSEVQKVSDDLVKSLQIRTPSSEQRVALLSGGNQQKVVLAKWLAADAQVLLLDEPTVGIDVGARAEIYELMNQLVERGAAIVMVSSDLPEVLGMSDRIIVLSEGRLTYETDAADATQDAIMAHAVPSSTRVAAA